MSIIQSREDNGESVVSVIGSTIVDVITIPFDFVADVVKVPFDFVGEGVSGITTKVVLIGALAIGGIYILTRPEVLKGIGGLR
jgi:hypothetical protein